MITENFLITSPIVQYFYDQDGTYIHVISNNGFYLVGGGLWLWPSASYRAGANSLAFISQAPYSVMGCNFAILFTQQGIYEISSEF
jgi:hypothetical protein